MKTSLSALVVMSSMWIGHAHATASTPAVVNNVIESSVQSEKTAFKVEQVVKGLSNPWALDWLPDGRMLVTERSGHLYLIDGDHTTEVTGLPPIHSHNQGGLLDIAIHPDYDKNGWIYFTYSSPGDADGLYNASKVGTATALARAKLSANGRQLTDLETLYAQSPRRLPGRHYGSRIVFFDDDTVLFSIGDRGLRAPAQDLTDPAGSIIRLKSAGGAYEQNPFVNMPPGNLRPEIYSYGHRNNQAMALNPKTGDLWTAEHGPNGGCLLHIVKPGNNYGWPQVAFAGDYSTSEKIGIGDAAPGVTAPIYGWKESVAPSGMLFYSGDAIPEWKGSLFIGSLRRQQLHRIEVYNDEVEHEEFLLTEMVGRIRDVQQGPDGFIYVITDEIDGDAGVYRISPAK